MFDGAVKVEFFGRPGSRKLAQAPQRDLDVAGAELDVIVEILEFTPLPDLDRTKIAIDALTDAHAFWVVAKRTERRRSGGADPFAAALMAALLLLHALPQRLQQLVEAAQRLNLFLLLFSQVSIDELFEPFCGNVALKRFADQRCAFKDVGENPIKLVEITLILNQGCTRKVIEVLHAPSGKVVLHGVHEGEIFPQRDRHARRLEPVKEADQHGGPARRSVGWAERRSQPSSPGGQIRGRALPTRVVSRRRICPPYEVASGSIARSGALQLVPRFRSS